MAAKKPAKKKKPTITTINRRLDALARDICKIKNDFTCERCGAKGDSSSIEWAHIEKRSKKAVRWSQNNCLALCNHKIQNCHAWFDGTRTLSTKWLQETHPDKFQWLVSEDLEGDVPATMKMSLTIDERLELEQELKEEKAKWEQN